MKRWIHASTIPNSHTYIVDSTLVHQSDKAVKLPIAGKGESIPRYYVWFPLKTAKGNDIINLTDLGDNRTKVVIQDWILKSKRKDGSISYGDDILCTRWRTK